MLFWSHKRGAFRLGRGAMDSKQRLQHEQQEMRRPPRLDRRNAAKNFDYGVEAAAAGGVSWSSSSSSCSASSDESPPLRPTRSLDLPYSNQTSFRIGGIEGEVEILCRSLGLSGPEDFAISLPAWEARKALSSSDLLHRRSPLSHPDSATHEDPTFASQSATLASDSPPTFHSSASIEEPTGRHDVEENEPAKNSCDTSMEITVADDEAVRNSVPSFEPRGGDGGIRGVRPSILAPPANLTPPQINLAPLTPPPALPPPPYMSLPAIDGMDSAWDIVRSFAPEDKDNTFGACDDDETDEEDNTIEAEGEEELVELRLGETSEGFTGTSSYSTMNVDDDKSSMSTETMLIVSPNGKFKRNIKSWMRGRLLGSGSYGMVYEGISDVGVFFAVKEVSLLDQGSNAQQCILQLEQEIMLLSQFEHQNIVQYYGTDKEEAKLFIFLELITQGSLASLYQKYRLQDTQVSAYTRQILYGLKYLHERNVVHRDIKCANILVHANGSVKLADFGLAKEITKFNVLKSCKGSVYWMAPEVVNPRKTYGPACDIWSLGCTVLEMLTRQIPYPNLEWTQALFRIGRGEQPPIPSYLSRDAQDFISQCVKLNPSDRPSASQLLEHPFVKWSLSVSSVS
ncbi:mitogen-activated protein kinase kinase kinase 1-like [Musa acuminata AAA Group]|uniref:mitogen-activated protein kinase kinase kinase 1-like n=1 Tax=Musa acuminata AAA Group TaxID=214697 RepID=UPI0031DD51E3